MSKYLMSIATRSSAISNNTFLPNRPEKFASETGSIDGIDNENFFPDSVNQTQFVQQNILPAQPIPIQKLQVPLVQNNATTNENKQQIEPGYFSKHIDREEVERENITPLNKSVKTIRNDIETPKQTKLTENIEEKIKIVNPVLINKSIQKIVPEIVKIRKHTNTKNVVENPEAIQEEEKMLLKKMVVLPVFEKTEEAIKKGTPYNRKIERITPVQPKQVNPPKSHGNHPNQPANKLVIGKIVVEVLPPVQPLPQKVITRVVPSAIKNNHPKSPKLMFGLGQL